MPATAQAGVCDTGENYMVQKVNYGGRCADTITNDIEV